MKSKVVTASVAAALLGLVSGCTWEVQCSLLNRAGADLRVTRIVGGGRGEEIVIPHGSARALVWGSGEIRILRDKDEWVYETKAPPAAMSVQEGWFGGAEVFNAVIESSGAIYVLPPGDASPQGGYPAQPRGFPLLPEETRADSGRERH